MERFKPRLLILLFLLIIMCSPEGYAQKKGFRQLGSHGVVPYDLRKIWNPSWFQGNLRSNNYYEGWYFKVVSQDHSHRYAFIPGISLGQDGHAFVQVIDGRTGETQYHRFPLEAFSYSRKGFAIRIGNNEFSETGFSVDLGEGANRIRGELGFSEITRFPVSLFRPGIMGWYRFVPFMETYHGVVSLDHQLEGFLTVDESTVSFNGGVGYIEKDWGSSMPQAWIWMQSNSFAQDARASFMLSVAHIPWLGSSFTGFLGYLYYDNQVLFPFATYTSSKLVEIINKDQEVFILIEDPYHKLFITGLKGVRGELLAPVGGAMNRPIHESLDASLHIRLEDHKGNILFQGETTQAGLELVGDQGLLQP